jgi:hypothetical protein
MNRIMKSAVLFLGMTLILMACTNRDKISSNRNYDQIYFDYHVSAEEGDENATCVFQFKNGSIEGAAVDIDPATVQLDGQELKTDSAKLSGYYYESRRPIGAFKGKHAVVFTTPGDKEYKNNFEFTPFTLKEELPETVKREPFVIELQDFPATERSVRLLLLDTAFESKAFNDMVPVLNGRIHIDDAILSTVKNGPINLELYLERERRLEQTTQAGGRISITYGLRREFELVE